VEYEPRIAAGVAALTAAIIFSVCNRTNGHCGVLSTTTAIWPGEILLVLDVLVGGEKNLEPCTLGFG